MIVILLLDTLAILLGALGAIIALKGETWRPVSPDSGGRLTRTGWLAAMILLAALVAEVSARWAHHHKIYEQRVAEIERENSLFWAARTNICWVVVENMGARWRFDTAVFAEGRSFFEAVLEAQGHNPSAQSTIEQYGLARTEAWISHLQQSMEEGELEPGDDCDKEFPEQKKYVHKDPPTFLSGDAY